MIDNRVDDELVSIIICNFNHAKFLGDSIRSAISQDYNNIEIIVVDDGSTDESRLIIESWRENVTTIVYKENGGQRSAYNVGFGVSRGEFLLFLDADDFLYENAVSAALDAFVDDVIKVHFKLALVDENGNPMGKSIPRYLSVGHFRERLLTNGWMYNSAPASGNVYKRSAIAPLFPIQNSEYDKHGADFFLIFGCCLYGQVAAVNHELGCYRLLIHQGAASSPIFGNAANVKREPTRQNNREKLLINKMVNLGLLRENEIARLLSFPTLKMEIGARSVIEKFVYSRIKNNIPGLLNLFKIFFLDKDRSFIEKVVIIIWAFVVTILPSPINISLVRYACNSASR